MAFDDDEFAHSDPLGPNWDPRPQVIETLPEGPKREYVDFEKGWCDLDIRNGAESVRSLRVGDEVGVWSGVMNHGWANGSDNVMVIEGVRVTVFWEV